MNRSPAEIRDRWLNYGKRYARWPTLWDSSLTFASGPLSPEAGTLHDYSERTSGATWSVGAGDVPKYVQGSVRWQSFWAGQYDGVNDYSSLSITIPAYPLSMSTWCQTSVNVGENVNKGLFNFGPSGTQSFQLLRYGSFHDVDNAGGGGCYQYFSRGDLNTGNWCHIAYLKRNATQSNTDVLVNGSVMGRFSVLGTTYKTSVMTIDSIGRSQVPDYINANLSSFRLYTKILTPSEIATLATHPLAAYETVRPRYWMFGATTHLWPWQIRRSRRVRGKR